MFNRVLCYLVKPPTGYKNKKIDLMIKLILLSISLMVIHSLNAQVLNRTGSHEDVKNLKENGVTYVRTIKR